MRIFFAPLFHSQGHMVRCPIWSVVCPSQTFFSVQFNTTIGARLSIRLSFLFLCNKSFFRKTDSEHPRDRNTLSPILHRTGGLREGIGFRVLREIYLRRQRRRRRSTIVNLNYSRSSDPRRPVRKSKRAIYQRASVDPHGKADSDLRYGTFEDRKSANVTMAPLVVRTTRTELIFRGPTDSHC